MACAVARFRWRHRAYVSGYGVTDWQDKALNIAYLHHGSLAAKLLSTSRLRARLEHWPSECSGHASVE